jgi:aminopeptidase S
LPATGTITLRFRYFYAQNNNGTTGDFFRVRVVGVANGLVQTVFTRAGTNGVVVAGAWTTQTVNLSSFAGQEIRLRIEAGDTGGGGIIEAGFDNLTVTRQ